jgi:putative heme-binding domain-containing protein
LLQIEDSAARQDLLSGMLQGLEGRRHVDMPAAWPGAYARLMQDESLRQETIRLALLFDDPTALRFLRQQATNRSAPAEDRRRAVQALVAKGVAELAPLLLQLIDDPDTQADALRGLAHYDQPGVDQQIIEHYASLPPAARQDALQTLASRPAWALTLMEAVQTQHIPRGDLSAYTARQLSNLGDPRITAQVQRLWGQVRATPADKARQITQWKRRLTPEAIQGADRSAGRALFDKSCANCHRLFGAGSEIGPDITGAQRTNLDYLLQNLIDPSAAVSRDYQMEVIETTAGRIITGLVVAESDVAVNVQTVNEKVVVPRDEIALRSESQLSLMPDGLLQDLTPQQVRDLIAYVAGGTQVAPGERNE